MSDSSPERVHSRKRPWLAMLLTVIVPGLGHVYLKLWLRALLWLALYVTATTFVLPGGATPASFSVEAVVEASQAIPLESALLVLGISVVCLVDVYMMTSHINNRVRQVSGEVPQSCPNCGKELDEDLTFCHWCTTKLDEPVEE